MVNKLDISSLSPAASSFGMARPHSWLEIDRDALLYNLNFVKKRTPHAGIMAVIKANAYGHGVEKISKLIAPHVDYFAVASCSEALQLRASVKKIPILLLTAALAHEYKTIAKHQFIPIISSLEEAEAFAKAAPKGSSIHIMIDTGMGRLGLPLSSAENIIKKIATLPLTIQSFSTHLSCADSNIPKTKKQLQLFEKILLLCRHVAPQAFAHVLNSAGVLRFPKYAHDSTRIGLMLYGISPIPSFQKFLRPTTTWKAHVTLVHELSKGSTISYDQTFMAPRHLTVAVIPVGYADGYFRQLSNKGVYVLINGQRCPLLGRVTMDQIIVDVSRAGKVTAGSEVVLFGKQGRQEIRATWLAAKAETIVWHLFTNIGSRVERLYK